MPVSGWTAKLSGRSAPASACLLGVTHDDTDANVQAMARKLWHLRIFADADGAMNLSVADAGGAVLVVSQFTLYGDTSRGRRPSWVAAAPGSVAEPLVDAVVAELRHLGATVATGRFGAHMLVELVNDGPVTLVIDA